MLVKLLIVLKHSTTYFIAKLNVKKRSIKISCKISGCWPSQLLLGQLVEEQIPAKTWVKRREEGGRREGDKEMVKTAGSSSSTNQPTWGQDMTGCDTIWSVCDFPQFELFILTSSSQQQQFRPEMEFLWFIQARHELENIGVMVLPHIVVSLSSEVRNFHLYHLFMFMFSILSWRISDPWTLIENYYSFIWTKTENGNN